MSIKSPQETIGIFTRLWAKLRLAWSLFRDPRAPLWPKILFSVAALAYLFFPLDFLPDVTPVVGQLDDLTVLALAVQAFVSVCPKALADEHLARIMGQYAPSDAKSGDVIEGEYTVKED
jgi:uncharacterized membrane protein YkvA (DUF1232 family)